MTTEPKTPTYDTAVGLLPMDPFGRRGAIRFSDLDPEFQRLIQVGLDPLSAIYDAERGCFRDLGGDPAMPFGNGGANEGDLCQNAHSGHLWVAGKGGVGGSCEPFRIVRRAEHPKPDLIYFPWPHYGNVGVIGPRGDIPLGATSMSYFPNGDVKPESASNGRCQIGPRYGEVNIFRFPTDATLTWVRDESEVPPELLAEAKARDAR